MLSTQAESFLFIFLAEFFVTWLKKTRYKHNFLLFFFISFYYFLPDPFIILF